MAIPNNLIVVIQNEPRDGDIVYLEKDEKAFHKRLVELEMVGVALDASTWQTGQTFYNEDDFCSVTGHEVQFPYPINNVCDDCYWSMEQDAVHKAGSSMVINFVEKTDCENCKEEEE
jgi:hypothetical protein